MSDRIIINKPFKTYYNQISELPENFFLEGETLLNRKNRAHTKKINITTPTGETIETAVKVYYISKVIRGFAYANLKKTHARRSMINAKRILDMGFLTPDPIACIERLKFPGICYCNYYVSKFWDSNLDLYSILYQEGGGDQHQVLFEELAHFSAKLHNNGIFHLDFHPGNILVRFTGTNFNFSLIDLDHFRFTTPTIMDRIKGLVRLTIFPHILRIIGFHYFKSTNIDIKSNGFRLFHQKLIKEHDRFWSKKK